MSAPDQPPSEEAGPEPEAAGVLQNRFWDLVDSKKRLRIAPLKLTWMENVLNAVAHLVTDDMTQEMTMAFVQEVQNMYFTSVRRACVDYELKSPRQASKMHIDLAALIAARDWAKERCDWNMHLRHSWRILRITGIDHHSVRNSRRQLRAVFSVLGTAPCRLQQLWLSSMDAGSNRLCDSCFTHVDTKALVSMLPLSLEDFDDQLMKELSRVRSQLKTSWLVAAGVVLSQHLKFFKAGQMNNNNAVVVGRCTDPKSTRNGQWLVGRCAKEKVFANAENLLLQSCSVLMSRQLRECVELSIQRMVTFYEEQNNEYCSAFELSIDLSKEGNTFEISPSFEELHQASARYITRLAEADSNFPSVELLVRQNNGDKSDGSHLSACRMAARDEVVNAAKERIREIIDSRIGGPADLLASFQQFLPLYNGEEAERVEKLKKVLQNTEGNPEKVLQKFTIEVNRFWEMADRIRNFAPGVSYFPLLAINCRSFKKKLARKAETYARDLIKLVVDGNRAHMDKICLQYNDMHRTLVETPLDSKQLQDLQEYWAKCDDIVIKLQKTVYTQVYTRIKFVFKIGKPSKEFESSHITQDDTRTLSRVLIWPNKIKEILNRSKKMQDGAREDFVRQLRGRQDLFKSELASAQTKLTLLQNEKSFSPEASAKALETTKLLTEVLETCRTEGDFINKQENELQIDEGATDYETGINEMVNTLTPLKSLWESVNEYIGATQHWFDDPLNTINAESADTQADGLRRAVIKCKKQFKRLGMKAPQDIAEKVGENLKNFLQQQIPLMTLICTQGLKQRHWDEINRITGLTIERTENTTLADIAEAHLENYVEEIEETCVGAVKEYSLEKALNIMEAEWADMQFTCKPWKDTGTFILADIDEIQQMMDDQIVKTQAMRGSRYIKPFAARCGAWEKMLKDLEEIIENWLKTQGTWLYLEPIFSSDDIKQQMPTESKRFTVVNQTWRDSMQSTHENPGVLSVARQEGLLERLLEANKLLDLIQKGLNDYLETKRLFFPRFFFLSNDELLEILAETKDPTRVQPHLKKCFEGINGLCFEDNLDIVGMISKEKEVITYVYDEYDHRIINPNDSKGLVERWLLEVETVMRKATAYSIDCSMAIYSQSKRTDWIAAWRS